MSRQRLPLALALQHPVAIDYDGLTVLFAVDAVTRSVYYDVLDPSRGNADDSLDWSGYAPVPMPSEIAIAGMSIVRITPAVLAAPIVFQGLIQALTDQQYIYLFQASGRSIYVSRYVLGEGSSPNPQGGTSYVLRPSWEVRYKRSGSADLPASDKDSFSAMSVDGSPFLDPIYELPFGYAGVELGTSSFWVALQPTSVEGAYRWQVFIPVTTPQGGDQLAVYSFARSDDGWFEIDAAQVNTGAAMLEPDALLSLTDPDGTALPFAGMPSAASYYRQEAVVTNSNKVVTMRRAARLLVTVPVTYTPSGKAPVPSIATVDFGAANDGSLALIDGPGTAMPLSLQAGLLEPAGSMLVFDGNGTLDIGAGAEGPLVLGSTFTIESWCYPTTNRMARQCIVGNATPATASSAPTLFIINGMQVGATYSDGSTVATVTSTDNVLALNAWNHVALVGTAGALSLFINGIAVPLSGTGTGGDPVSTPITTMCWNFAGALDEIRYWTIARSVEEIDASLYVQLPPDQAGLGAYYALNEGEGSTTRDGSGNHRTASLNGASWASATSPVEASASATTLFGGNGLTAIVGLITPLLDHPNFGLVAPGSRASAMQGADGTVHLYYQRSGSPATLLGMQYSTNLSRAYFSVPWISDAGHARSSETGQTVLIARQSGEAANRASASFSPFAGNPMLCEATFVMPGSATEQWVGLPRRLDQLTSILNGTSVRDPFDPRLSDPTSTFFDPTGTVPIAIAPWGDPDLYSALWFLGTQGKTNFSFSSIALAASSPGLGDLTLSFTGAGGLPAGLSSIVRNVPMDAAAFVQTLNGRNGDYEYGAPGNAGGTLAFAMPTTGAPMTLLVNAAQATFTLTAAADGNVANCNFEASVTPAPGPVLAATWTNLPRDGAQFVEGFLAGASPAQKAVLECLQVQAPTTAQAFSIDIAAVRMSLLPVLRLLTVLNDGVTGPLAAFSVTAVPFQSARQQPADTPLLTGSATFAVTTPAAPTNGLPAVLDLANGTMEASLLTPAVDGGWLQQPPIYAVNFAGGTLAAVPPATTLPPRLAPPLDLTVEAWSTLTATPTLQNPRLVHVVQEASAKTPSSYALGLTWTSALQIIGPGTFSVTDSGVQQSLVLFQNYPGSGPSQPPNFEYSVVFYVNADLATGSETSTTTLFSRTSGATSESLVLGPTGILTYSVSGRTVASSTALASNQWSMVVVTSNAQSLDLWINGVRAGSLASPTPFPQQPNVLAIGPAAGPLPIQTQLNGLAIYTRCLDKDAIAARLFRPTRPDDPGLQFLWGMDDFAAGSVLTNQALATMSVAAYNGQQSGQGQTPDYLAGPGVFFRAFFSHGDSAVVSTSAVVTASNGPSSPSWNHVAGTVVAKRGLNLARRDYGTCGTDASTNFHSAASVEAWIWPAATDGVHRNVILAKNGAADEDHGYEFGVDPGGAPYLDVRIDGASYDSEAALRKRFRAPTGVLPDQPNYLVATVATVSTHDTVWNQTVSTLVGQVYLNGAATIPGPDLPSGLPGPGLYKLSVLCGTGSGWYAAGVQVPIAPNDMARFSRWYGNGDSGTITGATSVNAVVTMPSRNVTVTAAGWGRSISLTTPSVPMTLGAALTAPGNVAEGFFGGSISNVGLWTCVRTPAEIANAYAMREWESAPDGLVSSYLFREQAGNVAYDSAGVNNATLTTSRAWASYVQAAALSILVNGAPVTLTSSTPGMFGDWGLAPQASVGGRQAVAQSYRDTFTGQVTEVRLWSIQRTVAEILDNMNRRLAGSESGLAAYWQLATGSGIVDTDLTSGLNDLTLYGAGTTIPGWLPAEVPIANEGAVVENAVNGQQLPGTAAVNEGPVAFEYASNEVDAYGRAYSVMKRGYAYVDATGHLQRYVGYKVGDLERVYVGQIQTHPKLIGYVEGAPPLPSENLTVPFYLDGVLNYFNYDRISSVEVAESLETEYVLSSATTTSTSVNFESQAGWASSGKEYVGLGVSNQVVDTDTKIQAAGASDWSQGSSTGAGTGVSSATRKVTRLENHGAWESAASPLLPSGERRFIPANVGLAVVKSGTADVYGLYMPGTGALVSLAVVPSPNIPVDVNVIPFQIDPGYVRNGTLDGYVGFVQDPGANRGPSYMRSDAYELQARIEAASARAQAWYGQVDAARRAANRQVGLTSDIAANPYYSWAAHVPGQGMINKYVWSARAGLYSEGQGYGASLEESYGGDYELSWGSGLAIEFADRFVGIGVAAEFKVLAGTGWRYSADKGSRQCAELELNVEIKPESFLRRYLLHPGDPSPEPLYSETAQPGKVDAYRFATYYLAPSTDNTNAFAQIVDSTWLQTTHDPNARAIRQMLLDSAGTSSWRVLHRVTYVSRIPPTQQSVPIPNQAPPIAAPANIQNNGLLLNMLRAALGAAPTARDIGLAVRALITQDMPTLVPWWTSFLAAAQAPNSPAAVALQRITAYTIAYLTQSYAAQGNASAATALLRSRNVSKG